VSIGTGHVAAERKPESEGRRHVGRKWKLALASLVGVYALLAGYGLISSSSLIGTNNIAAGSGSASAAASRASTSPSAKASPTLSRSPAPQPLGVASVAAFGPEGTSDGDNSGIAFRIIDASSDQPWYTQWYATPGFGGLRSGTGLLLDMGKTVTVRDVRLVLGSEPGADVQILVGNSAVRTDMISVGGAADVSGKVRLPAVAASGRYVLVWFTRLPPDGPGRYQVSVYSATVDGTAGAQPGNLPMIQQIRMARPSAVAFTSLFLR
jgi:hypothetical protein